MWNSRKGHKATTNITATYAITTTNTTTSTLTVVRKINSRQGVQLLSLRRRKRCSRDRKWEVRNRVQEVPDATVLVRFESRRSFEKKTNLNKLILLRLAWNRWKTDSSSSSSQWSFFSRKEKNAERFFLCVTYFELFLKGKKKERQKFRCVTFPRCIWISEFPKSTAPISRVFHLKECWGCSGGDPVVRTGQEVPSSIVANFSWERTFLIFLVSGDMLKQGWIRDEMYLRIFPGSIWNLYLAEDQNDPLFFFNILVHLTASNSFCI